MPDNDNGPEGAIQVPEKFHTRIHEALAKLNQLVMQAGNIAVEYSQIREHLTKASAEVATQRAEYNRVVHAIASQVGIDIDDPSQRYRFDLDSMSFVPAM